MKFKHLLTTLLAAAALTVPAFAQDDETPLGLEMSKINKTIKVLGRNILDPGKKEANLAQIAEIRAAMEKAATYEPAKAKDVEEKSRAKFVADYKAAMEKSLKTLDDMKVAVSADKSEEAGKLLEALAAEKKEGHKAYKKD